MAFYETYIDWQSPTGSFSKFRVVRNQNGFPETEEDGTLVYEFASTDGTSIEGLVPINRFRDGEDNPSQVAPIPGRPVYYRVFLFTAAKYWVVAGSIVDVMPKNTGATETAINLLPRVYTTPGLSPLGVVDPTSDLYLFLDAFGFTYEQMLTELDLIRPQYIIDSALYTPIPIEDVSVGLEIDYNLPIVNQRRLIRDALYLYSQRGLKKGVENYAESLTGYAPTVTVSSNILLTVQDSTFYKSIGNWSFESATAVASLVQTPASGAKVIDTLYTCEVTATDAFYMILGASEPITQGVPVTSDLEYTLSCSFKSPTSDGSISVLVNWYDGNGAFISTDTGSYIAANNTWKTGSVTATAPATAVYAAPQISSSSAGVFFIDQVCMQLGAAVSYEEARAITLDLVPKKINYIENPSFEINSSSWSITGATFSQDASVPFDGWSGSYSGKFVAASTWDIVSDTRLPVTPGSYFSFSMYTKSADMTSMTMSIDVYDTSDSLINSYVDTHMVGTSWMRGGISGLINSDWDASYAKVTFSGTAGTLYLDMVQAEASYQPTDYIDGSMPEQFGAIWSGTANASSTLLYPSKLVKIPRLAYTLQDWVPMNAWWRITTPAGVEYTNLTAV